MSTEGSCLGLNLIVDEIKVSCLMVVLSLGEIDALSRGVFPSGSEGIVWVLTEEIPPHPYLLLIVLADHLRIEARSVLFLTVSCDSRDSTGHNNALCEHLLATHAVDTCCRKRRMNSSALTVMVLV
jgi:hypothetical protein